MKRVMAEQCAVIGVGQTHHKKKRADVSIPGLLREAATRALEDAECTWADIDAVVIGKAPDAFEGIVQPELFLADALGGAGKPMLRVHTAGSVGGSTFIVGVAPHRVAHPRARARDRVGEAERRQRAVGPGRRSRSRHRRGRRVRAVDPRVHREDRRARVHRLAGRGEGPAQRVEEPVRAPAPPRHHASRR